MTPNRVWIVELKDVSGRVEGNDGDTPSTVVTVCDSEERAAQFVAHFAQEGCINYKYSSFPVYSDLL